MTWLHFSDSKFPGFLPEIWKLILSNLSILQLIKIARTSRLFRKIIYVALGKEDYEEPEIIRIAWCGNNIYRQGANHHNGYLNITKDHIYHSSRDMLSISLITHLYNEDRLTSHPKYPLNTFYSLQLVGILYCYNAILLNMGLLVSANDFINRTRETIIEKHRKYHIFKFMYVVFIRSGGNIREFKPTQISDLPREILQEILNVLPYLDLIRVARVSKEWRNIAYRLLGKTGTTIPIDVFPDLGDELLIVYEGNCNGCLADINNTDPKIYKYIDSEADFFRKFNEKLPYKKSKEAEFPYHIHKIRDHICEWCIHIKPNLNDHKERNEDQRIECSGRNKYTMIKMLYDIHQHAIAQKKQDEMRTIIE